jgi:putative membrane protein
MPACGYNVFIDHNQEDTLMASDQPKPTSRTLIGYLGVVARGFAMGSLEIVPGVSGGTLALILGLYEELVSSVQGMLNREAIGLLFRLKVKQALDLLPWKFLAALASGVLLAAFTMSHLLEWVLQNYPALLWACFFGLIAAAILAIGKRVQKWRVPPLLAALVGAAATYLFVGLVPVQTPDTWWFWFLSGAIAICGMVLPGMSGSFILLLLGKYEPLLAAVTRFDLATLFLVIAGAGIGLVSFAQILGWLLKRYHDPTIAFLMGMLLGSLRKIWPWKETLEFIVDAHGNQIPIAQRNILPPALTWEVGAAVLLAVLGFLLIWQMTAWAERREKSA